MMFASASIEEGGLGLSVRSQGKPLEVNNKPSAEIPRLPTCHIFHPRHYRQHQGPTRPGHQAGLLPRSSMGFVCPRSTLHRNRAEPNACKDRRQGGMDDG
jgi:hypothetical protein